MNPKLILVLSLILLLITTPVGSLCASEKEIERFSIDCKNNVKFQDYFNKNAKPLGSGTYGTVYSLDNYTDLVIKKIDISDGSKKESYVKEATVLRQICKHKKEDYPVLNECPTNIIPSFIGCVSNFFSSYLYQERMAWDFSNEEAKIAYLALSSYERVTVMLDIIDRFIQLHEEHEIIHSDIKPANIMLKQKDFSDIRIIDFGMAGKKNEDYAGGTPGFFPPELRGMTIKTEQKLSYDVDTYALGMTFAVMEGNFDIYFNKIATKCNMDERKSTKIFYEQACIDALNDGVNFAFRDNRGLNFLTKVLRKAIGYKKGDRFKSMKDFSNAIIKKLTKYTLAQPFLKDLFFNYNELDPSERFPSYWRDKMAKDYAPPKKPLKKEAKKVEKSKEPGFWDKFASIFVCNKKKKTPQETTDSRLSTQKIAV